MLQKIGAHILVSGASGFIGSALVSYLESKGHQVVSLVRGEMSRSISWNPEKREACSKDFEGFDAVIHLAGEPLVLGRWSPEKKEKLFTSRVETTRFLSEIFASLHRPPKLFICASAAGFYGDRGEELLNEDDPPGSGFLSKICQSWESAAKEAAKHKIRVVHTRFGVVIGPKGGALQKMLLPYRLGLGARLGSGKQWISWIDREDLVRAMEHILLNSGIEGSVNFTAPYPVRQEEFSRLLARILHRPHFLSIPAWTLRLAFGLSANELLLSSARIEPSKLLATNFSFKYPDVRASLLNALNKE